MKAKLEQREPSYEIALKSIKASIITRGGIAEYTKVLEAVVWNFYKHLPTERRRAMMDAAKMPTMRKAPATWQQFTKPDARRAFTELTELAGQYLQQACESHFVQRVYLDCDGRKTTLLMLDNSLLDFD